MGLFRRQRRNRIAAIVDVQIIPNLPLNVLILSIFAFEPAACWMPGRLYGMMSPWAASRDLIRRGFTTYA